MRRRTASGACRTARTSSSGAGRPSIALCGAAAMLAALALARHLRPA
ncbi:hypothetical protein F8568_041730 [Actinomadura sp. LD22]|uniref:Uncharacterized protein n=1 Tax=Actinomadura physcomitrii TaxID=2650748 RepID=A0A6I4MSE0_9ACTN|nr:hypothetical protein [Actinomadura physcomitrii]MWA06757.1 hypothetical protein [Actinomadura physcomitrii]